MTSAILQIARTGSCMATNQHQSFPHLCISTTIPRIAKRVGDAGMVRCCLKNVLKPVSAHLLHRTIVDS
ncbi:hypothetical protein M3J09_002651 [Ascochyta lentis]